MEYFWKKKVILSFLAAALIVVIHNSAINQFDVLPDGLSQTTGLIHNFFAYGLGGVAVPFFFFMAGAALFRDYSPKLYKKKMKSRTKSLVVPYLIWNTVGLLFTILCTFTPLKNIIAGRELFEPSFGNVLAGIFLHKYNFHFWFLFDLIIYVALTPVIDVLISKKWSGGLLVVGLLAMPMLEDSFIGLDLSFTVFYVLGCVVGKHYLKEACEKYAPKVAGSFLVITILVLVVRMLSIYGLIELPMIVNQITLLLLLAGIYISADLWLPKMRLKKIMNESFPIYVVHPYAVAFFVKILVMIAPGLTIMMLIAEVGATVLAVLVSGGLALLVHKRTKKLYDWIF